MSNDKPDSGEKEPIISCMCSFHLNPIPVLLFTVNLPKGSALGAHLPEKAELSVIGDSERTFFNLLLPI